MATTTPPGLKAPDDPRLNTGTIEEQITTSIARGFETVLSDKKSAEREMISAAKELKEAALVMTRVARDAAVASGGSAGVVAAPSARGSAVSVAAPGRVAFAAEEYLHNVRRAEPEDFSAAVQSGGIHELAKVRRTDLRNTVFNAINDRVQNTMPESPDRYVQGPDGRMMLMAPGVSMDAHGRYRDQHGRYVSATQAATAVDEDEASIARHYARSMTLRAGGMRVAEAWRSGQPIGRSLMASLPQGALKAAGTVALAASVAKQGWEWAQGQYAENQKYQEIYGGSNIEQFGTRFDRWKTGFFGNFSLLGGGAYSQAWDDAAQLGLRGGAQDRYIDANIGLRNMGVNGQQTREILNTTVEADLSLRGLAESIKMVNNAARDAGMNASRARDIFMKNYEASSSVMFGQEGVKGFSAALTSAQISSLPRSMWGIDLTGTFTRGNMDFAFAQRLGQDVTQFRTMANNNPATRTMMSEEMVKRQLTNLRSRSGKTIPQVVEEFMNTLGTPYSPEVHGVELGQAIEQAGFLREIIGQIVNQGLGTSMSDPEALIFAGTMFTTESLSGRLAQNTTDQINAYKPFQVRGEDAELAVWDDFVGASQEPLEGYYMSGLGGLSEAEKYPVFTGGEMEGATRYPIAEALVQGARDMGMDEDTKVQVETTDANGKKVWKVVSLKEALFSFPDQIQSGKAKIVGGASEEYLDKPITEIFGISPEALDGISYDAGSSGRSYEGGQLANEFFDERRKDEGGGEGGSTTNVVIGLDPRAYQFLTVLVNGNPYSPSSGNYGGTALELPTGP